MNLEPSQLVQLASSGESRLGNHGYLAGNLLYKALGSPKVDREVSQVAIVDPDKLGAERVQRALSSSREWTSTKRVEPKLVARPRAAKQASYGPAAHWR